MYQYVSTCLTLAYFVWSCILSQEIESLHCGGHVISDDGPETSMNEPNCEPFEIEQDFPQSEESTPFKISTTIPGMLIIRITYQ